MNLLFNPRSVAVIGVSKNPKKIGAIILENIISGGYRGDIYPVNPAGGRISGLKVFRSIEEIERKIDVAVISIPAPFVFDAVKSCADKKVRYCVIVSAGFAETGNKDEEKRIVEYAKRKGTRILGPNVLGYYSASVSLNMTFGLPSVYKGHLAVISQSGGLGVAMVSKASSGRLKLASFFSVGNKSDIEESDLLDFIAKDSTTRAVLLYMEGIKRGRDFLDALEKTSLKKPVIIVKGGSSKKGLQAAASHTGALACSDEMFSDLMKQYGALKAESLTDAIDWSRFFTGVPVLRGKNTLIITNGGGLGVLAADAMEKRGINLYDCYDDLEKTFSGIVPAHGSYKNPIDLTADYTPEIFDRVIRAALNNKNIHAVFVIHCHVSFCDADALSDVIAGCFDYAKKAGKLLLFNPFGGGDVNRMISFLHEKGVPVFDDFTKGVSCLDAMLRYRSFINRPKAEKGEMFSLTCVVAEKINEIIEKAALDKRNFLLADETRRLMNLLSIDLPEGRVCPDEETAAVFAEKIGFPVALKVVSPDILHKTDAGGVRLNIKDSRSLRKAFCEIKENCFAHKEGARFLGVEVSRMLEPGIEFILGARRDPSFGPVVVCGLGGIYVEVLRDAVFRAFPLNKSEAYRMLEDLKSSPLLKGVRGGHPMDTDSVVRTVFKLGSVLTSCPAVEDIELNPVFLSPYGIKAADSRVTINSMNIKGSKPRGKK